jgi:hypothetical protein
MKIGILTRPCGKNYGGIFQCLALQNVLINNQFEVEVIQFTYKYKNGLARKFLIFFSYFFSIKRLYEFVYDAFRFIIYPVKKKPLSAEMMASRNAFIQKYINFTESVNENSIGELSRRYDAIVVGSDIVWKGLGKKYLPYLFDWAPEFGGLRISYAACSGSDTGVPFLNKKKAKIMFQKINAMSVRDMSTYEMVRRVSGIKPKIVVDPTFLYDYMPYIGPPAQSQPYIFVYILGNEIKGRGGHNSVISRIKKRYGAMKVIAVVIADVSLSAEDFADEVIYDASPEDWLNLIYYAGFVYTDSFHGCVFSLKYKKNFLGYYSSYSRSSRLKDFAKRYNTEKYIVASTKDMVKKRSIEEPCDFSSIDAVVDKYKAGSLSFLLDSLKSNSHS